MADVLKVDEDGFVCCSGRDYLKHVRHHQQDKGLTALSKIINVLGERSAISQKLKQIITTTIKFYNSDQRIYIKVSGNKALGFVKVGEKKLFYHDFVNIHTCRSVTSKSCNLLQFLIYMFMKVVRGRALGK